MLVDLRLDRVAVRTSRLADLDVLCETDADSLPTEATESTDRRARLRSRIEIGSDLATDGVCFFTVECDGRPVGDIQARAPRYGFPPGVCEIGISLLATARGHGVGRVAVRLFSDFLLAERWSECKDPLQLTIWRCAGPSKQPTSSVRGWRWPICRTAVGAGSTVPCTHE